MPPTDPTPRPAPRPAPRPPGIATDLSVISVAAVITIILVIAASMSLIVGYLHSVVDAAAKQQTFECVSWRLLRGAARGRARPPCAARAAP